MQPTRLLITLLLAIRATGEAHGQSPIIAIRVDQDVLFPPAEDKDYTMGVQVDFLTSGVGQTVLGIFDWPVQRFAHEHLRTNRGPPPDGLGHDRRSSHVGLSAFTVQKGPGGSILRMTQPIPDDRPYASIAYVRARRVTWRRRNAFATELTAGLLGLPIAEWTQTFIHRYLSDDVDPGGWHNQIRFEPTAAYSVGYRRQIAGEQAVSYAVDGSPGDIMLTADGSLGYYTNVRLGAQARLGLVKSPWPTAGSTVANLPVFLFPPPPESGSDTESDAGLEVAGDADRCWCALVPQELYAWLNGGWTIWAYNALLQGQLRTSPVELSYEDDSAAPLRRGVLDVRFGITARWNRAAVTWIVVTRHSPLFDGPKSRFHQWGGIHITFLR